jgi:putative ABC transport system permease protein
VLFVGRFTARTGEVAIDPMVLGFTLLIATLTGIVFGTLPALGTRVDLVTALKDGRGAGTSLGHRRIQSGLIVVQVAVSVVLLVSAGLLLVSFYKLQQVDPGYRTDHVLSADAFGNFSKYPNGAALLKFYVPLIERLQQQPGVVAAAVTNAVPFTGAPGSTPFQIEGRPDDNPDRRPTADINIASPQYFEALGIPLVAGRHFSERDHEEAPPVALINTSMTRYWENRDPIGSRVSVDNGETWQTIVGVVGDVRQYGLDQEAIAQVYIPLRQARGGLAGRVLVRTQGDPFEAAGIIRNAIHQLDPEMPVENVNTLAELRSTSLARPRLTATLLAIFAALALFVTLAGITGVIATSVSERTREFGIRMALGAEAGSVVRMVLGQGMALVLAGLVLGMVGSVFATRVLSGFLFEIQPTDPLTLAGVTLVLLIVAAVACFLPARRATLVQPTVALRST